MLGCLEFGTLGQISVDLTLDQADDKLFLRDVVPLKVVLYLLKQILGYLKCKRSHFSHVVFLHIIIEFRVQFVVNCLFDKLCHRHALRFDILLDLGMKVGIDFDGNAFLFVTHRRSPYLYNS